MTAHVMRRELEKLRDPNNALFVAKLNPNLDPKGILGIKSPVLRDLAKTMRKDGTEGPFLSDLPHRYLEENILHGMLISGIRSFDECLRELERFLPYINSWIVTDTIRPKVFQKHTAELEPVLYQWLKSTEPYTVRMAIGLFMACFLKEGFDKKQAKTIAALRSEDYYVRMMIAWYMATALITQRETIIKLLEENRMDVWTHNKTIQKAVESYRISEEDKAYLRTLRRKK